MLDGESSEARLAAVPTEVDQVLGAAMVKAGGYAEQSSKLAA